MPLALLGAVMGTQLLWGTVMCGEAFPSPRSCERGGRRYPASGTAPDSPQEAILTQYGEGEGWIFRRCLDCGWHLCFPAGARCYLSGEPPQYTIKAGPGPLLALGAFVEVSMCASGMSPGPSFLCFFPVKGPLGKTGSQWGNGGCAAVGGRLRRRLRERLLWGAQPDRGPPWSPLILGGTSLWLGCWCPPKDSGGLGAFLRHFCPEGMALRKTECLQAGSGMG